MSRRNNAGPLVDQRRVDLHGGGAGLQAGRRVVGGEDPAAGDRRAARMRLGPPRSARACGSHRAAREAASSRRHPRDRRRAIVFVQVKPLAPPSSAAEAIASTPSRSPVAGERRELHEHRQVGPRTERRDERAEMVRAVAPHADVRAARVQLDAVRVGREQLERRHGVVEFLVGEVETKRGARPVPKRRVRPPPPRRRGSAGPSRSRARGAPGRARSAAAGCPRADARVIVPPTT